MSSIRFKTPQNGIERKDNKRKLHMGVIKPEELPICNDNFMKSLNISQEKFSNIKNEIKKDMSKNDESKENNNGKFDSAAITNANNIKLFKIKQKNEKNFKDLNKSLANLALYRLGGRSSSDNDAKLYIINNDNEDQYHHIQNNVLNDLKVEQGQSPNGIYDQSFSGQKSYSPFLTPARTYFNNSPTTHQQKKQFYPIDNSELNKIPGDKELFNPYNDKLQMGSNCNKNLVNIQKPKSLISHTVNNTPLIPKIINQKDHINHQYINENLDYKSNHIKHIINETQLKKPLKTDFDLNMDNLNDDIKNFKYYISKTNPDDDQSTFTPAFKGNNRQQANYIYTLQDHIENHTKNKLDEKKKTIIHNNTQPDHYIETLSDQEIHEKLDLDKINDGVEYTQGGVGIDSSKKLIIGNMGRIKQNHKNNNIIKLTTIKEYKNNPNPNKNFLQYLKQDILKIKEDMELRKQGYDEVNKFVRLYENDFSNKKESWDYSVESPHENHQIPSKIPLESNLKHQEINDVQTGNIIKNCNSYLTTANTPRANIMKTSQGKSAKFVNINVEKNFSENLRKTERIESDLTNINERKEQNGNPRASSEKKKHDIFYDLDTKTNYLASKDTSLYVKFPAKIQQTVNFADKKVSCCDYASYRCIVF